MYQFIQISLTSDDVVYHEERKNYLRSLWGNHFEHKKGFIAKFSGAIGFTPVMLDYCSNYPYLIEPQVETPDSYKSPMDMLYNAMWVDLSKHGIVKFVVPFGIEEHPISKYSYNREEVCKKFVNFLSKIYPNLHIEVTYLKSFKYSAKTFIQNYFYQSMDFNDNSCTVECSSHRLLTDKEIQKMYKDMEGSTTYKWHINQFYCETCKSYHPDSPYHIEIVYEK